MNNVYATGSEDDFEREAPLLFQALMDNQSFPSFNIDATKLIGGE